MTTWFRVAPLSDEELLEAVQSSLRELILPELERLGADEFTLSQVRSTMSMVGFVRRGLEQRISGQAQLLRQAEETATQSDAGRSDPEVRRLLLDLLALELRTRSGRS